jgi:hypothetical protein
MVAAVRLFLGRPFFALPLLLPVCLSLLTALPTQALDMLTMEATTDML